MYYAKTLIDEAIEIGEGSTVRFFVWCSKVRMDQNPRWDYCGSFSTIGKAMERANYVENYHDEGNYDVDLVISVREICLSPNIRKE